MHIDHHLQLNIVKKLAESDKIVSFSELKQDDIENSLFSYHLKKLIAQGIVKKVGEGYSLTTEGARWLHFNDFAKEIKDKPRVYVSLVIQNENGDYLVGQRTGQFKQQINDYLLPGFFYSNDQDLPDQIQATLEAYIPKDCLVKRLEFGMVQFKVTYDGSSIDSLTSLTYCLTKSFEPSKVLTMVDFEWHSQELLESLKIPSAQLLCSLFTYTSDEANSHTTPLFIS